MQITDVMRSAIDEERAKANSHLATANRLRNELQSALREAATYRHLLGGAEAKLDRMVMKLERIIALTDTGSDDFRDAFDPKRVGEIPSGWRVVEKIRETILGV